MINIKGILPYDGSAYLGWQEVGMGPTIEGALQKVLRQIFQCDIPLQAASRTDAGVHATGQVINFLIPKSFPHLKRNLNALLPLDIRVVNLEEALPDFHPTLDAISKEYHYHLSLEEVQLPIERHTSWHCPHLDREAMKEGVKYLVGKRDFAAFTNTCKKPREGTVRTLHSLDFEGDLKVMVRGDAFLFRMVRNLVGTLVQVGQGKLKPDDIPAILDGKDRRIAGVCAPAHGLTLASVVYA